MQITLEPPEEVIYAQSNIILFHYLSSHSETQVGYIILSSP